MISIILMVSCSRVSSDINMVNGTEQGKNLNGKFSFLLKVPDNFFVDNLVLKLSKQKPIAEVGKYYDVPSDPLLLPFMWFLSASYQKLPNVPKADLLFMTNVLTNTEYSFTLEAGDYYASLDSMKNSDFHFTVNEAHEYMITFGFSHHYPKYYSAEINDYKEKECTTTDKDVEFSGKRKNFKFTVIVFCPKIKIKPGVKTMFILNGGDRKTDAESIITKLWFFWLGAPLTNAFGYFSYRNYKAEMFERLE